MTLILTINAHNDSTLFNSKLTTVSHKSFNEKSNFKTFIKETPWVFTLSGHVVDDDGNPFNNLFNVSKSWNFLSYPSKLSIEGEYKHNWSFGLDFAYTNYYSGKSINNEILGKKSNFFSADAFVRYKLKGVFGDMNWFDPFVVGGYGYTYREAAKFNSTATANAGLGFNIWIWKNLGFNVQSVAKFAMIKYTSNYLNHSVGIVYRLTSEGSYKPGRVGNRYKFLKKK